MNEPAAAAPALPEGGAWTRGISSRGPMLPAICIAVHFLLVASVNAWILRDFANSADEYSYVVSARLFAEGRLHAPSPEPRESFDFTHVVNDGKYYGKYPPGWPLLLSAGFAVGEPWLVNALISVATLILMGWGGRRFLSVEAGNLSMLLAAGNPFLVFNAASYFSHTACLFFVTVFVVAALAWLERPESRSLAALIGAAGGATFLIRPYTAAVLGATTLGYLLLRARQAGRGRDFLRLLAFGAGPALIFGVLYFAYNGLQTGNPWLAPFSAYDRSDAPSFTLDRIPWRVRNLVLGRVYDLTLWLALTPIFAAMLLSMSPAKRGRHAGYLAAMAIAMIAAHFLYRHRGGNQYGPRYVFEASSCLLLAGGALIATYGRSGLFMLAGALVLNISTFRTAAAFHDEQIRERMEVYDLVAERRITNAVVFLETGSGTMPPGDLTRNGTTFDGPVLYVKDRAALNPEVLERYPGRAAFVYRYDSKTGEGRLEPMAPAVPVAGSVEKKDP